MNVIWATRGRSWGFRFLLDGGLADPLETYDQAFAGTDGQSEVCKRVGSHVALRFPDPLDRRDEATRTIPHDIVVLPPLSADVDTVADGLRLVWPALAGAFAKLWTRSDPPAARDVRLAMDDHAV
jgi:hypothetical protein